MSCPATLRHSYESPFASSSRQDTLAGTKMCVFNLEKIAKCCADDSGKFTNTEAKVSVSSTPKGKVKVKKQVFGFEGSS